jgi:hypothetical protein
MAKALAFAGSMAVFAHAARVTIKAADADASQAEGYCGGHTRYVKCNVLDTDSNLLDSVCHNPLLGFGVASILAHDKCVKCDEPELVDKCKDKASECTAEKLGKKNEKEICQFYVFERSKKGREVTAKSLGDYMQDKRIECSRADLALHCDNYDEWADCETGVDWSNGELKDHFCKILISESASSAAKEIGGRYGAKCTAAMVRAKCGKQTCASLSEDEWQVLCQEKAKAGASVQETIEHATADGAICSEEDFKGKCKLPCSVMDEETSRLACFGFSGKGRKLEVKSAEDLLTKLGLSRKCSVNEVKVHCNEKEWPKCDSLDDETKGKIKDYLCPQRKAQELSDDDFVSIIGGAFGAKCSFEEASALC